MSSGDSLTGFNSSAFTAGAIGGALTLAGAVVAGAVSTRRANWDRFNRQALIAGIEYSELMRARMYESLQTANRKVADLQTEIIGLRAELKAELARQILVARGR